MVAVAAVAAAAVVAGGGGRPAPAPAPPRVLERDLQHVQGGGGECTVASSYLLPKQTGETTKILIFKPCE